MSDIFVTVIDCANGPVINPKVPGVEDGETTLEHALARAKWLKEHCGYDSTRIGRVVIEPA